MASTQRTITPQDIQTNIEQRSTSRNRGSGEFECKTPRFSLAEQLSGVSLLSPAFPDPLVFSPLRLPLQGDLSTDDEEADNELEALNIKFTPSAPRETPTKRKRSRSANVLSRSKYVPI